jgi:Resolvase, N terminal domain
MAKAKRAALYVRVSTDAQTVENQIRELRQVAERRGWEVIEVYNDAGISGAKGRNGRPGLDSMLKDASRRRFDVASSASGKAKGDSERSSGRGIDFGLGLRYQAIDGCESKQCSFMESVV